MKKHIFTTIKDYLNESTIDTNSLNNIDNLVDFDSFPEDIRKTLEDEYGNFMHNFDWNSKQDEYLHDPKGFKKWLEKNKSEEFLKNIDNIIRMTAEDMDLLRKKRVSNKKFKEFEDEIKAELGNAIQYGGQINLSFFENFVDKNPKYKNTFETWKKMLEDNINLMTKDLNAFRSSTPINKIRGLYKFLIDYKSKM